MGTHHGLCADEVAQNSGIDVEAGPQEPLIADAARSSEKR